MSVSFASVTAASPGFRARADRPRPDKRRAVYVTEEGLAKLEAQRDLLTTVARPELAERLHEAREYGNSVENGELLSARTEEEILEGLVAHLSDLIRYAVVIPAGATGDGRVGLGAEVRIRTASGVESFRILGRLEADPGAGRISNESPLGRALMGHRRSDQITWSAPSGVQRATLLAVGSDV